MIRMAISRPNRRAVLCAVAALMLGITGVSVAAWALSGSGSQTAAPEGAQFGGGHAPSQSLLDVYNSFPVPLGRVSDQEPVSRGDDDLFAAYWAKDAPETVASFYQQQLPRLGWVLESSEKVVTDKKDDGTQATTAVFTFVKENQRLIVGISANTNYAPLGQTHAGVTIRPR